MRDGGDEGWGEKSSIEVNPATFVNGVKNGFETVEEEEFLEDINNILNSGEVPNLFEKDELEQVLGAVRPFAKEAGLSESDRDAVFQHFISRLEAHLVASNS